MPADESPEIIYRPIGRNNAKALSLHRDSDWQTGLSFMSSLPYGKYLRFNVSALRGAGYIVLANGGNLAVVWWSGKPYLEPNSKATVKYPLGHMTLYHPDKTRWDEWHQMDQALVNTSQVSLHTQLLYDLREH